MERMHLVIQARRRHRPLQDLCRLLRRAGIHISGVELTLIHEALWSRLSTKLLLTLGRASLTLVFKVLTVWHSGKRPLLAGLLLLLHTGEELFGQMLIWLPLLRPHCFNAPVALHKVHQEFRIFVDHARCLRPARIGLTLALRKEFL